MEHGATIAERLQSLRASCLKAGHPADSPLGIIGATVQTTFRKGVGDVVEVVATTDDVDLDDEVVVPTGANLDYFRKNGSVFVDHDTRMASRVGVARSIRPWPAGTGQRGWAVDIAMDKSPLAAEVVDKARAGGMGVSIGFRARDWGEPTDEEKSAYDRNGKSPRSIVREWEWLELSFTPMPCNVACRVLAMGEPEKRLRLEKRIAVRNGVAFTRMVPVDTAFRVG